MPPRVVVTAPGFETTGGQTMLEEAGLDVASAPKLGARTPAELAAVLGEADAAIASTDPFDASVFVACRNLRVVARLGVGYDAIDVEAATAAGVAVTTTPGSNTSTVADHTVALMLAVLRRVAAGDATVRGGGWRGGGHVLPGELAGRTVGLVGYGAIGRMVGRRLAGFDVELLACDPAYAGGGDAAPVPLDELLERASVVSLHAPLLPATRGLLGRREVARMRADAVLVNTSRGPLVDEEALLEALRAGAIRGAGLDVFEEEPPAPGRFDGLDSVVLTPHVAGLSERALEASARMASQAVLDVLAGRTPFGLVNPVRLADA